MEEKTGVIAEIIFHNDDNGYTVAIMETEEEQLTVVGCIPLCNKGTTYTIKGTFKVHPTFGEQFAFSEYEEVEPKGVMAIEGFLASGVIAGVGMATARLIVNKFGEESLDIIEKEPRRLLEVVGIGEKRLGKIIESYGAHREFARVSLAFQEVGVSTDYALKLYKAYGIGAVDLIKENPYRLVEEVDGFGFKKADAIASKMGIAPDSPFRIRSGIKYYLSYMAGEGNTYMPQTVLCECVANGMCLYDDERIVSPICLDVPMAMVEEQLLGMSMEYDIKLEDLDGSKVCYLYPYYIAEQRVCQGMVALENASPKALAADADGLIKVTEGQTGVVLSEQQKWAIKNSLVRGVSIITGGPGTGKTTIINTIINIFEESELKTAIAAPTGRAAKRITETSGHYASTIHRLLEYYYSESADTMEFGKNEESPLDYDVIIVDEASMIDLLLMRGLVAAIKPGSRLILVGDADQLPSVGAGNVLRDLIDCDYFFTAKLTEIFRQAKESMIVVNAHCINHGEYPSCNEKDKDFFLMARSSEKEMMQTIKELISERLVKYYDWIVPVRDIQVLTPVRKRYLGSINLNKELQEVLNPPSPDLEERKYGDKIFREGDKVMQIRNNYQMGWKRVRDFTEGEGIFNGDVGFIEKIDKEFNEVTVVFDEDKYATYTFADLDQLELAYAVTVHKSQGSEFPIIIMPMTWFPPMLATRNLLYTAVTRGKEAVVIVGSQDMMNTMIDNNRISKRFSGLGVRLRRLLGGIA
ncbi:MAG TPA: ATP-dependent RecD-like DNA helicase [Anaerovoracaceae bacterium]|nr:ATP-dependent RecD-like DNA helicase [Anaerovoracaceae bacterium]